MADDLVERLTARFDAIRDKAVAEAIDLMDTRIAALEAENARLRGALAGLFQRLDHPLNGGQFVTYFLRWPEVEAARQALKDSA